MDLYEAIEKRISCRAYDDRPIEDEKRDALRTEIARINEDPDLHFQLVGPREDGTAIDMNKKMFAGDIRWYVALAACKDPVVEEKLGYFGERLVLLATTLGLGTCWVASTYDHDTVRVELEKGEMLHDVIPLGYAPAKTPVKQRAIRAGIRRSDKKKEQMYSGPTPLAEAPEWIRAGIDAVHAGPSAINEQPVVIVQDASDAPVRATLPKVERGLEYTDMGIAKLHFELAAKAHGIEGTWEWGEGGAFRVLRKD